MTDTTHPSPKTVTIYSTAWCSWCDRAKRLLERRNTPYAEVDIESWETPRETLESISGRRSVPQIFVGGTHIGGFDELAALDSDGALDDLLRAEGVGTTA